MVRADDSLEEQVNEVWALVHELDLVSTRLNKAATAALDALGLPKEGKEPDQE